MQEALASAAEQMDAFKNQLESSHKEWCEQVMSKRDTEKELQSHTYTRVSFSSRALFFPFKHSPLCRSLRRSQPPGALQYDPQVDPLERELEETRLARDEMSTRLESLAQEMELKNRETLQLRQVADQVFSNV